MASLEGEGLESEERGKVYRNGGEVYYMKTEDLWLGMSE